MLTKKFFFALILSASVLMTKAQNTTTTNDLKRISSFDVQILPDVKPTAFILIVENPGKKPLGLTISHKESGVVIDTIIKDEEFRRKFSFDEAVDGRYTVTVERGKEKFSKEVELSTVTVRKMKLD